MKIPRLRSTSRTPDSASRCQRRLRLLDDARADTDLHTETNNFAPNEFREVVNLSGLVVYKRSNARGNSSGDCNGKEIKAVNLSGVNYDGNMDRGPTTFTSDVSLPKDDNNYAG